MTFEKTISRILKRRVTPKPHPLFHMFKHVQMQNDPSIFPSTEVSKGSGPPPRPSFNPYPILHCGYPHFMKKFSYLKLKTKLASK